MDERQSGKNSHTLVDLVAQRNHGLTFDYESANDMAEHMIEDRIPCDWRDLQLEVAKILEECGLDVEVERRVQTVRGALEIDVHARETTQSPAMTYICECKHWSRPVPREVVHGFRTAVADYGAHAGIIISTAGFQSGAHMAAKNTNIILVDWRGFQQLFLDRWHAKFVDRLDAIARPLVNYTYDMLRTVDKKATCIPNFDLDRLRDLQGRFEFLARLGSMPRLYLRDRAERAPKLPFEVSDVLVGRKDQITSYRSFEEFYSEIVPPVLDLFDRMFGEAMRCNE